MILFIMAGKRSIDHFIDTNNILLIYTIAIHVAFRHKKSYIAPNYF